jgi:dCMP deaminase
VDGLRAGDLSGDIATVLSSIATQGTCRKRRVACVLKLQDGTTFHAANGTLPGMPTCLEGGCLRCASNFSFRHGMNYDVCVCVHAEAAAIGLA